MKYEIVEIPTKTMAGISIRTTNENMQAVNDIGKLWEEFWNKNIFSFTENKKNNKKRVEKKKSTYPSEDEDVFNLTWDEKEESTKKDKEFFGKKIVNLLKKCYNKCKNLITKIRKITDKMETVGDILEDEDIINAIKRIKEYGINAVKDRKSVV